MNLFDCKENVNISSAQFALSNFANIDSPESCKSLNEILINFKNKKDSWMESECLFNTNDEIQVFYGLTILIDLVRFKWNCISSEQQECICTFIMGKVLKLATTQALSKSEEVILRKFNHCLTEIFFVKWSNEEWTNLVSDLIRSCYANEYLCQNNILLFKYLYEMIFTNETNVYLSKERIDKLKSYLSSEFDKILKLTFSILELSRNVTLVVRTLDLLDLFIVIKFDSIRDHDKLFNRLSNLLTVSVVRKDSIRTILSLCRHLKQSSKVNEYLKIVLEQLTKIIPNSIILKDVFADCKPEDQSFLILISDLLAEFITEFYQDLSCSNYLEDAWLFLLRLTAIENDDISLICFDYWSQLSDKVSNMKGFNSDDHFYSKASIYLREVSEIIVTSNCTSATNGLMNQKSYPNLFTCDNADPRLQSIQNAYQNFFKLNSKSCCEVIKAKFNNLLSLPQVSIRELYSVTRSIEFIFSDTGIQEMIKTNSNHELVDIIVELMRYSFNSLLSLQNQMLTFKDQIPICCSMVHLIGTFSVLGNFHLDLSKMMLKRLFQFITFGNDLLKSMAIDSFKKWTILNKDYFFNHADKTGNTILTDILNNVCDRLMNLNSSMVVMFYDYMTNIISDMEDRQSQENYIVLYFKQPNEAWFKIIERISEDATALLDSQVLSSIRTILDINIRASLKLKDSYINQLMEISPTLFDLMNLMSLSLIRIKQKCCQDQELQKPPLSYLITARETILTLMQIFLRSITWNSETYSELARTIVPILMSDYSRLPGVLDCDSILVTLQAILESGDVPWVQVSSVLTGIIPPSQSYNEAHVFEDINDSYAILCLIKSIMRNYVPIITNSSLVPFIRLIHVIDFVLWGLKAVLNDTRQICYHILEIILQYLESDRVNSHHRKKFTRQFYLHIIETVIISSLDGTRSLEDSFVNVIRILSNWLSSSFISFHLNKGDRKRSKQSTLQQIIDSNKEFVSKQLLILLSSIYPHVQEWRHQQFIQGMLKALNAASINEIIREYRLLTSQYVLDKIVDDTECS